MGQLYKPMYLPNKLTVTVHLHNIAVISEEFHLMAWVSFALLDDRFDLVWFGLFDDTWSR